MYTNTVKYSGIMYNRVASGERCIIFLKSEPSLIVWVGINKSYNALHKFFLKSPCLAFRIDIFYYSHTRRNSTTT